MLTFVEIAIPPLALALLDRVLFFLVGFEAYLIGDFILRVCLALAYIVGLIMVLV